MAKTLNTGLTNTDPELMMHEQSKKSLQAPLNRLAITAPPLATATRTSSRNCQNMPPPNNQPVIPYEPNWGEVPDFDLMTFWSEIEDGPEKENAVVLTIQM